MRWRSDPDEGLFAFLHDSPISWLLATEEKFPNRNANKPQSRMTNSGRHTPDLTIFSFHHAQFDPYVWDGFANAYRGIARRNQRLRIGKDYSARKALVLLNYDRSVAKFLQRLRRRHTFDLNKIRPFVGVFRVQKSVVQAAFITEQK